MFVKKHFLKDLESLLALSGHQTEKSLSAHVLNLKITLRRRMMMPFNFADRYDPKQAFKHKYYGSNAFQKISGALQLNSS